MSNQSREYLETLSWNRSSSSKRSFQTRLASTHDSQFILRSLRNYYRYCNQCYVYYYLDKYYCHNHISRRSRLVQFRETFPLLIILILSTLDKCYCACSWYRMFQLSKRARNWMYEIFNCLPYNARYVSHELFHLVNYAFWKVDGSRLVRVR